jgi:hypothetical protein
MSAQLMVLLFEDRLPPITLLIKAYCCISNLLFCIYTKVLMTNNYSTHVFAVAVSDCIINLI